jgi:hypothetical protein
VLRQCKNIFGAITQFDRLLDAEKSGKILTYFQRFTSVCKSPMVIVDFDMTAGGLAHFPRVLFPAPLTIHA